MLRFFGRFRDVIIRYNRFNRNGIASKVDSNTVDLDSATFPQEDAKRLTSEQPFQEEWLYGVVVRIGPNMNQFLINSENTEDTFDSADNLQDAIRIAREVAAKGPAGEPVCIEYKARTSGNSSSYPAGR